MFKVTITELRPETETPQEITRYTQTVDTLDLKRVMEAINTPPRKPRVRRKVKE